MYEGQFAPSNKAKPELSWGMAASPHALWTGMGRLTPKAFAERFSILNLTLDHCLVGSSGAYFLLSEKYMLRVQIDFFHELWNNVNNGAKHTQGGRLWRSVLEFMIIANYNHGPFRLGAWHASKSEAPDLFLSTSSWSSPDFQDIASELAKHWGMPLGSANDYEAVFANLAHPVFGRHMAHRCQRGLGNVRHLAPR